MHFIYFDFTTICSLGLILKKLELPILENLFANNNRINFIDPFKIVKMQFLHTLNLQNNDLSQIPHELGKAEQIK